MWSVSVAVLILHWREAPFVRFQFLRSMGIKNTEFWELTPCSLVKIHLRASGTPVNVYQTMGRTTFLPNHLYMVASYSYCLKEML
jgi:hypothetical protein